ncbi:hypothetical protein V2J09_023092 [Rumex salicifolius]
MGKVVGMIRRPYVVPRVNVRACLLTMEPRVAARLIRWSVRGNGKSGLVKKKRILELGKKWWVGVGMGGPLLLNAIPVDDLTKIRVSRKWKLRNPYSGDGITFGVILLGNLFVVGSGRWSPVSLWATDLCLLSNEERKCGCAEDELSE